MNTPDVGENVKMVHKRKVIGIIIVFFVLITCILFTQTKAVSKLRQWIFIEADESDKNSRIDGFDKMAEQVIVKRNIVYSEHYKNSELDVYMPKKGYGTPKPTIFWAHGGAFIGGDKKSVADYSVMLASQGYVVVNMNYSLAPEYQYPTPLMQIAEAYVYIVKHAKEYDADIKKVAFGGDSAGGQIIGQFVNVQVNEDYAEKLNLPPVSDPETIKAVIFFSALLDLNKYDENENEYANHVFDRSAQAYFGLKQWKGTDKVNEANIIGNIGDDYPPTYLTDGNTASFQDQAEMLAEQLRQRDVPVKTTFFPREEVELRHEYQFRMRLEEAQENYKEVTTFLEEHLKE